MHIQEERHLSYAHLFTFQVVPQSHIDSARYRNWNNTLQI